MYDAGNDNERVRRAGTQKKQKTVLQFRIIKHIFCFVRDLRGRAAG